LWAPNFLGFRESAKPHIPMSKSTKQFSRIKHCFVLDSGIHEVSLKKMKPPKTMVMKINDFTVITLVTAYLSLHSSCLVFCQLDVRVSVTSSSCQHGHNDA